MKYFCEFLRYPIDLGILIFIDLTFLSVGLVLLKNEDSNQLETDSKKKEKDGLVFLLYKINVIIMMDARKQFS